MVSFSTDQGSLSVVTATTNATGQAVTQLTTSQAATVTATVGAKTGTVKVSVYAAPTIAIAAPTSPTALIASTFTLMVTPGTGAAPISDVSVNFGDSTTVDLGAVSGSISVSHAYASAGSFTVTVTVRDGNGQVVSASTPVVVYAAIPFHLVGHGITEHSRVQRHAGGVHGHAECRSACDSTHSWDFGDGTKGETTVPFVSHTYTAVPNGQPSQQLLVSVTATGADGRVGYGSVAITVTP